MADQSADRRGVAPRLPNATARSERRGLGILAKWVTLIVAVVGVAVAALVVYFPNRQQRELEAELIQRAESYSRLLDRELRPAIAFEDRETAREVFRAALEDPLVSGLGLYTGGSALAEEGHVSGAARLAGLSLGEKRTYNLPDRLLVVRGVKSLEGPSGTLVFELTKAPLERSRTELTRTGLVAGFVVLLLATVLAFFVARSMSRRVRSIASAAAAVASGEFGGELASEDSSDEIGSLGRAFNSMVAQLRSLMDQIRKQAQEEQERLEGLVRARTSELGVRNRDLRLVMDNVDQGFVTIDRDGRLSDERSRRIEAWFGVPKAGQTLWDYLDAVASGFGTRVKIGFEQLAEGFLPTDVALGQIPSRFDVAGRHHTLTFQPIENDAGEVTNALVIVTDSTAIIERERSQEDQRETASLVAKLVSDPGAVEDFLSEARETVARIERRDGEHFEFGRAVHTLKGNASIFGLSSIATVCHRIEEQLAEGASPESVSLTELFGAFHRLEAKLLPLLDGLAVGGTRIHEEDREDLVRAIRDNAPHSVLERIVKNWALERVDVRLARAAEYLKDLASRLGKGPVTVHVESERIRVEGNHWRIFWTELAHVLRNVVDHGIELPSERASLGKPDTAPIHLRAFSRAGDLVIEVEDHGRGIAWDQVRDRALELGIIKRKDSPRSELIQALFHDGLSTADDVTHTSGRGLGLSAIRAAVVQRGGHVEVDSEPGRGTRFSFVWPLAARGAANLLPRAMPPRRNPLS